MRLSPSMKSLIAMAARTALMASAAVVLCAPPATAQTKHSKAPIDITADQAEFHNSDCVYVYTGSVEALQDTARLRSDVMIAHLEITKGKPGGATTGAITSGCGATTSVEAKGHVYYVATDGRRVHGDNGFYDLGKSTVTITGDVTAVDASNNVMRGTKMVYNTQTGEGHVEGGGKGPNAKNRPRGVFYPKDSEAQASGAQATGAQTPGDQAPDAGAKKKKAAK
jgi:lipopolysaccharide export system protein LptA